jgi:hypothetical protein
MNFGVVDAMLSVTDKQCFDMCLRMSREEGLLTGGSSGLNMHAAVELSGRCAPGAVIVVVLPDSGIKYLSKIYSPEWRRSKGFEEDEASANANGDAPNDRGSVTSAPAGAGNAEGARGEETNGGGMGGGGSDPQAEVNVERVAAALGMERVSSALGLARPGSPTPSLEALTELTDGGSVEGGVDDKLVDAQVEQVAT